MEKQWNYNQITKYIHFDCRHTVAFRNESYLDNGCDVMNHFAKFENFLPHSMIPMITIRKSDYHS